ncbi:hypothetical protein LT708_25365 [Pseudomonas syringae pv. syringae]|uniref:hypothetical protein n=1 Tax=Pseudomonas syringae TaxID=317 RepID=UPI00200A8B50|nr:hypothetical protein [Pseudomonas syringae]MCK9759924.1 hypothetical protein [Pseudomonas syringae pv. syringae]MCK9774915.1 hypothetical protein [Pseudomonas syringae pv. syringae]
MNSSALYVEWKQSVIDQIALMIEGANSPFLPCEYFARHKAACEVSWANQEDVISVASSILEAERDLADIIFMEEREQYQQDIADTYNLLEAELAAFWKQDCSENGLI